MVEWKEAIWVASSAILVSIFILFLNTEVMAIKECAKMEQAKTNNIMMLKENFKLGRYDNTLVGQEDVINCIMEYKSKLPNVIVDNREPEGKTDSPNAVFDLNLNESFFGDVSNTYYIWDRDEANIKLYKDYDLYNLLDCIPYDAIYRARLIRDADNEIIHIWFTKVK